MRIAFSVIVCLLVFGSVFFQLPSIIAHAQSLEESDKKLVEIQQKIAEIEKQLEQARGQEKSLKSQLDFISSQTQLTELKIDETTTQIAKLEREISDLSSRITRLSSTVDSISQILLERIVQTYKYGNFAPIELLFSSNGFTDLLLRTKYIQAAQANDKKVLYQLQATKASYNDQKQDKESRQNQLEKLQKELEVYQAQLASQKKTKEELLRVTRNDEARFQSIISQLKAEQESITRAISNISAVVGPVTRGQQIAAMGSTGCSTGPHLHFEVFENAKVEGGRIVGNRVDPHNYLNNSKLGSPLKGYPEETVITTEYGEVYKIFGFPSAHTGLDIAPKSYEGVGRAIIASENGIAYSTSASCNYNIPGGSSIGKGIIIDHQNGLVTLYWHIL